MNRFVLCLFASVFIVAVSGCAWTPQHIKLNPQLDDVKSETGKGTTVGVKVVDERTERLLGHRSVGAVGAEMTIDDHPEEVIKATIFNALKNNGFEPVEYTEESTRKLKVEIREIKFYLSMGFWTGGVHTNVALKANASNNGKEYEEFYREENERRTVFVPGEKDNERDVNDTVSRALQKLYHDQKLVDFLAE